MNSVMIPGSCWVASSSNEEVEAEESSSPPHGPALESSIPIERSQLNKCENNLLNHDPQSDSTESIVYRCLSDISPSQA